MTALQEVKAKLSEIQELNFMVQTMIIRGEIERLLAIEKQQIIDAFKTGDFENTNVYNAEMYYNEKYETIN